MAHLALFCISAIDGTTKGAIPIPMAAKDTHTIQSLLKKQKLCNTVRIVTFANSYFVNFIRDLLIFSTKNTDLT